MPLHWTHRVLSTRPPGKSLDAEFFNIYYWLGWVFLAAHQLSLVVVGRGCPLVLVLGLFIVVAFVVAEHRL